jgi:hypothetical protein
MLYVGVDPGQTGGVCAVDEQGTLLSMMTFNKGLIAGLSCFFEDHPQQAMIVGVERVHSMPKQGVASTFKFGVGFGMIQGFLGSRYITYDLVTPQTWTKICRDSVGEKAKERTLAFADNLWGLDCFVQPRCRNPHSGLIDAAVIAYWVMLASTGRL